MVHISELEKESSKSFHNLIGWKEILLLLWVHRIAKGLQQVKHSPECFDFITEIDLIQLTWMPHLYPHLNCQVKQFFYGKFLCSLEKERCWLRRLKEETCFLRNRRLSLLELYCPWNLWGYLPPPLEHTALFRNILQHSWNNHIKILCEAVPESGKLCPTVQLCPAKLILIERGLLLSR